MKKHLPVESSNKKRRKDINLRRAIKESSSNKEDEVFLKASYEEDDVEVTKPSYK